MNIRLVFVLMLSPGVGSIISAAPAMGNVVPNRFDLEQALAFALDHNFAIRRARENIREHEGIVTTVSAAALPNVSAAGSFQKSNLQSFQTGTQNTGQLIIIPSGRFWRMNFTVRQIVYAGGGIRSAIDAAKHTREAAVFGLQETVNSALLDVRTRFYTVLLAREDIKVQEQNLELLQHQLTDVTNRYEAGSVSKFEQLRAEVALANAQPPLIKARNDYRLATHELRQAIGLVPARDQSSDQTPEFIGSLTIESSSPELSAALAAARTGRPELQRLAKLVDAAEAGELTARADFYPSLALTAGGELRKGPTESFSDSRRGLRAGAEGQWTGNPRATAGKIRQAESLIEQARLALGAAELAVQVEVRRGLSSLEEATELVGATRQSVKQAEEAVRIALTRYQAGMTPQLDLLQSQVALTTARTNQLRAYYSHNVALARLRTAMGLSEVDYNEVASPATTQP
ncbi:MAG: TolC family protein [Candidatus Didemnitutus sp.]|nr:TolC family protein [Verrucomicrobiota bacterium]MDP2137766.1 TolC family protein [Candidatus Didemnitutus sp.]